MVIHPLVSKLLNRHPQTMPKTGKLGEKYAAVAILVASCPVLNFPMVPPHPYLDIWSSAGGNDAC